MSTRRPALLFLTHRIPFPPNKGDKIRSFHWLEGLAKRYRVFLGTFIDNPLDWQFCSVLAGYCEQIHAEGINRRLHKYKCVTALLTGQSITETYYRNRRLQCWVNKVMAEQDIENILVFSSSMAQYVMGSRYHDKNRVLDFIDTDSDKWREYSENAQGFIAWLYRREARLLACFEKQAYECFNQALFVSKQERDIFCDKVLRTRTDVKTHVVPNGVDLQYYSAHKQFVNPYANGQRVIVFTGALDYWPNIDAVQWFVSQVFIELRKQNPALGFYIVGYNPTRQVKRLADVDGVRLAANVKDVRPYFAHAELAVAPMRIARGIQNKVLEALASGLPCVVSVAAIQGLDLKNGVVQAEINPTLWVQRINDLLVNGQNRLCDGVQQELKCKYAWLDKVDELLKIVENGNCQR